MSQETWVCAACTYINNLRDSKCTICNEPNLTRPKPTPSPVSAPSSPLPKDVKTWTKKNLQQWLTQEGLGEFVSVFESLNVDGKMFLLFKEEDLKIDLGITRVIPRQKILNFIQANKPEIPKPVVIPIPEEKEWSCLKCTKKNKENERVCTVCEHSRDGKETKSWNCPKCTMKNSGVSKCTACGADPKEDWSCIKCTKKNKESDKKCTVCEHPRDGNDTKEEKDWSCIKCTKKNKESDKKCTVCEHPRDGKQEEKDWSCIKCTKKNKESDKKCTVCEHPKDGKETKSWNCPKCTMKNFESVPKCITCGSSKDEKRLTPYGADDYLPWGGKNTDHADAVPLLVCDRDGKMLLDQKTAKETVFSNYSDPLVIVTFTGIPGLGKSTTASNFHNFAFNTTKELFRASSGSRSFTKGAWIGKRPLVFQNSSQQMMLMDLEGLEQRDECYHLQIAGMIFSDTVCYMNTGPRIDENLIRMLKAIIGLKEDLKMVFEYPKIVFLMTNSDHHYLENKFVMDDLERGGTKTVTHDEYRRLFLQDHSILQRAFGADKIYFRTLSRPLKNMPSSSLKIWESKSDRYYREMEDLVQLCSIPTQNKMKGVDKKVQLLATVVATLNSTRRMEVVNILKNIFVREITAQSSLLLSEKKLTLQRKIAEDYENKNVSPRVSLSLYYSTIKNEYDVALRQFAIGLGLIDEKTREEELKRLPFVREDSFYEFCRSEMNARRLREQEEREAMIRRALENKRKVLPKMVEGKTTCSNGHNMDTSKVVDVNCKNGQDGIWYWIRRGSAEKICENCKNISTFTSTICSACGGAVSSEVWNEPTE